MSEEIKDIRVVPESECCGCAACANACPVDAIRMEEGKEGFVFPKVDLNTCIQCGKCVKTCPVLEIVKGSPLTRAMGEGASLVTDIPRYRVYENGVFTKELTDASAYWKEGYVGFLIGCSFSFEEALLAAGMPVRHIEQGCNVPMFKTSIATKKAGPFEGPMVCSMRPMTPEQARRAYEITAAMPNVHGAPVQIGHPEAIGVADVMKPDYGDPVEIREGEIPVFWPCGVTPQAVAMQAKPDLMISHSPGYMLICDVKSSEL